MPECPTLPANPSDPFSGYPAPGYPVPGYPAPGCLADSQGNPLRFDPDNQHGKTQLTYRALHNYELIVNDREEFLKETSKLSKTLQSQIPDSQKALLKLKNQPVPIQNEHELAYLFVQEHYKKQIPRIPNLDPGAIFNVLAKA